MDIQRIVQRNGYEFYFYDNDENEDVVTMLDYMWYLQKHVNLVLINRVIMIGDSNLRNAFDDFNDLDCIRDLPVVNKSRGGRCARHLIDCYPEIVKYRYIIICVGNNDLNTTSDEKLLKYYTDLIEHLPYEHHIFFLELLPRLDHAEFYLNDKGEKKFRHTRLQSFNLRMKNKLGAKFYGNKIIHPCHFLPHDRAHLNDFGKKN